MDGAGGFYVRKGLLRTAKVLKTNMTKRWNGAVHIIELECWWEWR